MPQSRTQHPQSLPQPQPSVSQPPASNRIPNPYSCLASVGVVGKGLVSLRDFELRQSWALTVPANHVACFTHTRRQCQRWHSVFLGVSRYRVPDPGLRLGTASSQSGPGPRVPYGRGNSPPPEIRPIAEIRQSSPGPNYPQPPYQHHPNTSQSVVGIAAGAPPPAAALAAAEAAAKAEREGPISGPMTGFKRGHESNDEYKVPNKHPTNGESGSRLDDNRHRRPNYPQPPYQHYPNTSQSVGIAVVRNMSIASKPQPAELIEGDYHVVWTYCNGKRTTLDWSQDHMSPEDWNVSFRGREDGNPRQFLVTLHFSSLDLEYSLDYQDAISSKLLLERNNAPGGGRVENEAVIVRRRRVSRIAHFTSPSWSHLGSIRLSNHSRGTGPYGNYISDCCVVVAWDARQHLSS